MIKLQRAITLEPHEIEFPKWAQPKIDGIRAVVLDGAFYSRKGIALPNKHIQKLAKELADGLDGEIIVGSETNSDAFNSTQSGVMRVDGCPSFKFLVFDRIRDGDYGSRMLSFALDSWPAGVEGVKGEWVNSLEELAVYEEKCLADGYEGVMLRNHNAPYKFGTATKKVQELVKVKQFSDDEAKVIGVVKLQSNQNEAQKDALGRTKRSSAKAGKVETEKLGAFVVTHPVYGEFEIGTGYTDAMRVEYGANPNKYLNKYVTFKYMKAGMKDKPRFPVFKGFRDERDII